MSHSTTTGSGRPASSAARGSPDTTTSLSAVTVTLTRLSSAPSRWILPPKQVVADQNVVEPAIRHHLGLAELLAGDALGAGIALQARQQRALVGLDVRAIEHAGGVARRLDAGNVALDAGHVDDHGGRAVVARILAASVVVT